MDGPLAPPAVVGAALVGAAFAAGPPFFSSSFGF